MFVTSARREWVFSFLEADNVTNNVVLLLGLKNEVRHGPMWSLEEDI